MSQIFETPFDIVFLGLSPAICLEAIYQAEIKRKNVCLITKDHSFGGAWITKDILGFKDVEIGCHYLSRSRKAYNFLEKHLGVRLIETDRVFFDFKNQIIELVDNDEPSRLNKVKRKKAKRFLEALLEFNVKRIRFYVSRFYNDLGEFKYPQYGCADINNRIREKMNSLSNIKIVFSNAIKKVKIEDELLRIETGSGIVYASHYTMGQAVNIPIFFKDKRINLNNEPVTSIHYILHIKGAKLHNFTVLQKLKNEFHWKDKESYFFRITDVGRYFLPDKNEIKEDDLLLCCQVTKDTYEKIKPSPKDIVNKIKDYNLIKADSVLIDAKLEIDKSYMIQRPELEKLQKSLPKQISINGTWDLSYSIEKNYERWKRIAFKV